LNEPPELSDRHGIRIDPKLLHADRAHRQLLGIELLRADQEPTTGNPDHTRAHIRCPSTHKRILCTHNAIMARKPSDRQYAGPRLFRSAGIAIATQSGRLLAR